MDMTYRPDPLTIASGRYQRLCSEIEQLSADLEHRDAMYGGAIQAPRVLRVQDHGDLDALERANDEMARGLATAVEALESHLSDRRSAAFEAALASASERVSLLGSVTRRATSGASSSDAPAMEPARVPDSPRPSRNSRAELAAAIGEAISKARSSLAGLPANISSAVEVELGGLISQIGQAKSVRQVERALDEVRRKAFHAANEAREVADRRLTIDRLLADLDGSAGEGIDSLRKELVLLRARGEALPRDLEARVSDAKGAAQRSQSLQALRSVFAKHGYQVKGQLETIPSQGAILESPATDEHAVLVRVRGDHLLMNVVRVDANLRRDPDIDRAVEARLCALAPDIIQAGRDNGLELVIEQTPADGQIQVVEYLPTNDSGRERHDLDHRQELREL
jgi:hypothetical protein